MLYAIAFLVRNAYTIVCDVFQYKRETVVFTVFLLFTCKSCRKNFSVSVAAFSNKNVVVYAVSSKAKDEQFIITIVRRCSDKLYDFFPADE